MIRADSWASVHIAEVPREHRASDTRGGRAHRAGNPRRRRPASSSSTASRSCCGRAKRSLTDIAAYLIGAGGKRVRPAVTLLVFRACGGSSLRDVVDVAVALELIHSASLLHDDIIDGNQVRRGRDSARRKYGVAETLVTGDFLFSRAFQICGRFDERLIDWAAEACIALTEGEIMQGRFRHNPAVTYDDYLEIIARKTASLFEVGARTAAYLAGADDAAVDAMARCGHHVGLTFQMIDDLLDVTGAEATLGKPVGLDVREGNPSLPLVLAIADDDEVRRLFGKAGLSEAEVGTVLSRLRRSTVIARGHRLAARTCRRRARGAARPARLAVPPVPPVAHRPAGRTRLVGAPPRDARRGARHGPSPVGVSAARRSGGGRAQRHHPGEPERQIHRDRSEHGGRHRDVEPAHAVGLQHRARGARLKAARVQRHRHLVGAPEGAHEHRHDHRHVAAHALARRYRSRSRGRDSAAPARPWQRRRRTPARGETPGSS